MPREVRVATFYELPGILHRDAAHWSIKLSPRVIEVGPWRQEYC
jgi:hypothetical protein